MPATPDELVFLRGIFGLSDTDASQDAALLSTGNVGAGNVPTDPGFYTELARYSAELGSDPRDILAIIASESNFKTAAIGPKFVPTTGPYAGHDVTPRGLIGFTVANIPSVMSWEEWDALPKLSQKDQLAYVFKVLKQNQQRIGRPYANAFETYVSVAAPAHLNPQAAYTADTTLYSGPDWLTNPGIDSWPINFQRRAMLRGEVPEMNANLTLYLQKLAGLGLIHGRDTFGDLSNYLDRMRGVDPNGASWAGNPARWALAWNLAYRRFLQNVSSHTSKSFPYTPDVQPRYSPASFLVNTSSPGSAYSFDASIPSGPGGAVNPSAEGAYGGGKFARDSGQQSFFGSFGGVLVAFGILAGGLVAYAHFKK